MPELSTSNVLQLIVAFGLLNVWLLRPGRATTYRGGDARTLKQEFAAYGLPGAAFYVVGALKLLSAAMLIAGLWKPALVLPAAVLVAFLMAAALAMHVKVSDPAIRSVPASLMLLMSAGLCVLSLQ